MVRYLAFHLMHLAVQKHTKSERIRTDADQRNRILPNSPVFSHRCGPCRFVAPAVEDMAKDYAKQVEESAPADAPEEDVATKKNKIRFIKIDVDTDSELATKLNVTAMPTFMVFTDGELTKAIVGANVPLLQSTVEEAFKGIV